MLLVMRRPHDERDEPLARLRRNEAEVERRISEAALRGELSSLPGEARPLPPDPDEGAGDRWAAAHLLRNADAAPEWVELRREIFVERARLARRLRAHREWLSARRASLTEVPAERVLAHARATEAADRRFHAALEADLRELNAKIARHNLHARAQLLQLAPLTMERLGQIDAEDRPA
jgi:hypothetical protein